MTRNYGQIQAGAMSATYRVIGNAAKLRDAAAYFWQEYSGDPQSVSGDYVSDLVAELRGHVNTLAGLVAELDYLRAELDAASFPAVR